MQARIVSTDERVLANVNSIEELYVFLHSISRSDKHKYINLIIGEKPMDYVLAKINMVFVIGNNNDTIDIT